MMSSEGAVNATIEVVSEKLGEVANTRRRLAFPFGLEHNRRHKQFAHQPHGA